MKPDASLHVPAVDGGARRWLIGLLVPLVFGLVVSLLGWGNATSQRLAALEVRGQVSKEQFDRMEGEVRETRRAIDRLLDHFSIGKAAK